MSRQLLDVSLPQLGHIDAWLALASARRQRLKSGKVGVLRKASEHWPPGGIWHSSREDLVLGHGEVVRPFSDIAKHGETFGSHGLLSTVDGVTCGVRKAKGL